jgi:hypothetical protein
VQKLGQAKKKTHHFSGLKTMSNNGLVRLAGCQPASSVFLSHQFSISHQPPVSQQYFSLATNQPQLPATSQPNEANVPQALLGWSCGLGSG